MTHRRFVAVGDSLTEGKGDTYPDGSLRGFADLLAHALRAAEPGVAYANLARPSVRIHEVRRDQVGAAGAFQPDLVTVVVGVNDIIAVRFDAGRVAEEVHRLIADVATGMPGATILTATLPDLGHLSRVAALARRRVAAVNQATRAAVAAARGVRLVDLEAATPFTLDELALDRVHPSARGHLRFAEAFGRTLGLEVPVPEHLPARPAAGAGIRRICRTVVVAPRFITRRLAREQLIASQPPKRGELLPLG